MGKRKERRVTKKLFVSFDKNGFDNLGLTSNLSRDGLCVASTTAFPVNREILLSVAVPGKVFDLKGEVMWCRESGRIDRDVPENIGIRLTQAPAAYLNYVELIRRKHPQRMHRKV